MKARISMPRRAIWATALVVALVLPAGAAGKTHKLSGKVEGDANATVSMKVKVSKKGQPKRVKDFAWTGLDGFCDGIFVGEQSGTAHNLSAKPQSVNDFRVFGPYDQAVAGGDVVDISGFLRQRGKKVVRGLIDVSFNGGSCDTNAGAGSSSFTATKG